MADGSMLPVLTGNIFTRPVDFGGGVAMSDDAASLSARMQWLYTQLPYVQAQQQFPIHAQRAEAPNRRARRSRKPWMGSKIDFAPAKPLEVRIFNRLMAFKILTSRVAMHLDGKWKDGLFRQLDFLLDVEEWDSDFALPSEASFETFLRVVTYLRPFERPSLGASEAGTLVASWKSGDLDLFMDFLPGSFVRWVASRDANEGREALTGNTLVESIIPSLTAFGPSAWFARRE